MSDTTAFVLSTLATIVLSALGAWLGTIQGVKRAARELEKK